MYARTEGSSFGSTPAASGEFEDTKTTKSVPLDVAEASFVMLVALSEAGNRGPWSSAAEVSLAGEAVTATPPPPPPPISGTLLSQADWTVTADSQESLNTAARAIDGDADTFWHTQYKTVKPPHPHRLTIDLGGSFSLSELRYTPRQTTGSNGNIGRCVLLR